MRRYVSIVMLGAFVACVDEDKGDAEIGGSPFPDAAGDDDSGSATADNDDGDGDDGDGDDGGGDDDGDDGGDGDDGDDGGGDDDSSGVGELPSGLNGTVVDPRPPAPTFVATNLDGSERGRDDLTYRPTVMWFYPLAGTPG